MYPITFKETTTSTAPEKCRITGVRWAVQVCRQYVKGGTCCYSKTFWYKKEATEFINKTKNKEVVG